MVPLQPDETELLGAWGVVGGRVAADATAHRIEAIIAGPLEKVAVADAGWSSLDRDPADGRLWEPTFPHGNMHASGPLFARSASKTLAAGTPSRPRSPVAQDDRARPTVERGARSLAAISRTERPWVAICPGFLELRGGEAQGRP
jgi:hypothetical protein